MFISLFVLRLSVNGFNECHFIFGSSDGDFPVSSDLFFHSDRKTEALHDDILWRSFRTLWYGTDRENCGTEKERVPERESAPW
jgi:hypothetical protein